MRCDKKQNILVTATKHFAQFGFDGARVDEIAAEAGVNKATLYYRIGNKEAIYEEVFIAIIDCILTRMELSLKNEDKPESQLRTFANVFASSLDENPHISPLILREIASGGLHMNDQAIEKMHKMRQILTTILKKGEDDGVFHSTNAFLIHMLLIGTLNFYSASSSIRNKMSQSPEQEKVNFILPVSDIANEVVNLILKSIRINH